MELVDVLKRNVSLLKNKNLVDVFEAYGFVVVFDDLGHEEIEKSVDEAVSKVIELEKSNAYHFEVLVEQVLKEKNIRSSCHITSLSNNQISQEEAVMSSLIFVGESDCDKEK